MNRKKYTVSVQTICFYISMLIACIPVIDYYCNWYITMIPLIYVLLNCGRRDYFNDVAKILIASVLYSLLSYWFVYRDYDLVNKLINDVLLWVPAIYAYREVSKYEGYSRQRLLQVVSILLVITAVTTIMGLNVYPSASRQLASGMMLYDTSVYTKMNIGGFDYIYGLICFVPIQMWLIKNTVRGIKCFNIVIHLIFFLTIMKSQYTTALILFIVFTILCGFSFSKKKFAVLGAASLLLVTSLRPVLIWLLSFVQRNFALDYAGDRIQQLIQVLSMQTVSTQTSTTRIDYYFDTITGFFESPIWGHSLFGFNRTQLQGHSTILDVLYNGGILYLFVFFWIIIFILRKSKITQKEMSPTFTQLFIAFIIVGTVNPLSTGLPYFILCICGSCVNYLESVSASEERKR